MSFKQQLKKAYDKDASRRDRGERERQQWKLDARQRFADVLHTKNKKTILELGSGAGLDAKFFKNQGFEVLATDLSPKMIEKCQKRSLRAKAIDLYDLDSLGEKFDGIYSLNVLLHVPRNDLNTVLQNIAVTLNEGGIFFYGVYGGYNKEETFIDKNKMGLPRFFSFLSDQTIKKVVKDWFEIIDFQTVDVGSKDPNFHFQSLLLRKK